MAGVHIEQMAQMEYNKLIKEKASFESDIAKADKEIDRVADKPYYRTQDRDIDDLISLRDDAQHNVDIIDKKISDLLDRFGYCIDIDSVDSEGINNNLDEDVDDDFDYIDAAEIITKEEEEFAASIYNFLQEVVRQDDNYNAYVTEDFASETALNKHFNKHCIAKHIDRKSSRQTVFYDFKDNSGYKTLEKELRDGISSVSGKNSKIAIDSLYKTDDVIKGFHRLFEGGDTYLIFTPLCGFFVGESTFVTYCFRSFANKNTKNYKKGNTIDFIVIDGKNTNTLFPIDANYLENKFNNYIKKYNNKFKGEFIINRSDRGVK